LNSRAVDNDIDLECVCTGDPQASAFARRAEQANEQVAKLQSEAMELLERVRCAQTDKENWVKGKKKLQANMRKYERLIYGTRPRAPSKKSSVFGRSVPSKSKKKIKKPVPRRRR